MTERKVMVVLLELLARGVLCEEQLGEALKLWIERGWGVEPVEGYSLQAGGKDPTQEGVIFSMDHHFVLILMEMLYRVALTGVALKV